MSDNSNNNPGGNPAHKIITSLPKEQAKLLTEISKTRPQMESISSRNVIKYLPWVNVTGGSYRVNRRMVLEIRPGLVSFVPDDSGVPKILASSLNQMPSLRKIDNEKILQEIADAAEVQEYTTINDKIVNNGDTPTHIYIIYRGKVSFMQPGVYEAANVTGTMGPQQYFGGFGLHYEIEAPDNTQEADNPTGPVPFVPGQAPPLPPLPGSGEKKYLHEWQYDAVASTKVTVLKIEYAKVRAIIEKYLGEGEKADKFLLTRQEVEDMNDKTNRKGEALVQLYSYLHENEPGIPSTFVAYDPKPREYELSTSQTILRIHTKVADLYNSPYNQTEEQVRLTVEELREAQEEAMINNQDFGLLHNVDYRQRVQTQTGPPTPDDMDELLSRRRKTQYIFAHAKAIAAFTRECNKRGINLEMIDVNGSKTISWRGVPIFTCNKIPIEDGLTTIIAMRTGEENQGVVGLYQMGIPDEIEASMSVRFMGINDQAIISYLITNYFSVAVLVPDALGILENVEVGIY